MACCFQTEHLWIVYWSCSHRHSRSVWMNWDDKSGFHGGVSLIFPGLFLCVPAPGEQVKMKDWRVSLQSEMWLCICLCFMLLNPFFLDRARRQWRILLFKIKKIIIIYLSYQSSISTDVYSDKTLSSQCALMHATISPLTKWVSQSVFVGSESLDIFFFNSFLESAECFMRQANNTYTSPGWHPFQNLVTQKTWWLMKNLSLH